MMFYEDLKRMILDSCRDVLCNENFILDSIDSTAESKPYEERIDAGEYPRAVVREFAKKIVDGRTWTVRVDGKAYLVRFTSSFKGEVASKVPSSVNRNANERQRKKKLSIAKRTIICLANLEKILASGKCTRLMANDDRIKAGITHHKGWRWIYAGDKSTAVGAKGTVLVQMAFPNPEFEKGRPNTVYNVAVEGNKHFPTRQKQFRANLALNGEVDIVLN